jgi:membrane-associated phospholipid phosphatase
MTMLFPALILVVFKKLNIVGDYEISAQKERIFPYLIFFFFYLLTFLTFRPKEVTSIVFMEDPLIATVLLGATVSLVTAFFLNNFLKVSVHTLGVTNLFVFSCLLSSYTQKNLFYIILITLIMVGLVGSSRIYLRAHTVREVYFGFICGALGQLIAFTVYFTSIYKA